ncbi:Auxin response factor 8 [Glycine soja]|uniref:Auxin response factor 8 n=1 Tax=Glycine soja TaxID=3848 RepID=A0A0B2QBF5_GLYSO|nr:Auxin response factor 8 [Glycine soja]
MKLSTSGLGQHGHEGTRVVYFPQGHSEQVAATTNREIDGHIPNYPSLPPQLICQLHNVTMHVDVETDEVYAQMTLQPLTPQEMHDLVDSMVERLRTLSRKSDGQFIVVDLRVEMLDKKGCQGRDSEKEESCFNAQEVAVFLRKIGFEKDTTIYVTQSRWDESLDSLKDLFPKTYTKESIIPADKKKRYLDSMMLSKMYPFGNFSVMA